MKRRYRVFGTFWLVAAALVVGLGIWYTRLDERQKGFVKNFVRQIPDLPGRYMV